MQWPRRSAEVELHTLHELMYDRAFRTSVTPERFVTPLMESTVAPRSAWAPATTHSNCCCQKAW